MAQRKGKWKQRSMKTGGATAVCNRMEATDEGKSGEKIHKTAII